MNCETIKASRLELSSVENHYRDFFVRYIEAANDKGADIEGVYMNPDNGKCCIFHNDRDPISMPSARQALDYIYFTYNLMRQRLLRYKPVLVKDDESIVVDRRNSKPQELYLDKRAAPRRQEDYDKQAREARLRNQVITRALEGFAV
jgi:hypothetical protein